MIARIAELATRRSKLVVAIWLLVVIALAGVGKDLEDKASAIHAPYIDGTQSKRAHEVSVRAFGTDNEVVVVLHGPDRAVERQGKVLASRLGAQRNTLVVSPWAREAAVDGLRPKPGIATLIVRIAGSKPEDIAGLLPPIETQIATSVRAPVHASLAGLPVVVESVHRASTKATKIGELIAVPVLLLILLFVFRSVLAAIIPVLIGGSVVAASKGVLSLLFGLFEIELFAVAIVGMMGLALGVDYTLLVVSRFREEQRKGGSAEAARTTVQASARSLIPAGCGLILAMVVTALILPRSLGLGAAIAVTVTTALSMVSAICVVPALLTLLGTNLERWSLPPRETSQIAVLRWSRRITRRPGAVVAILFVLVFCAGWALTLDSGIATAGLLPAGDRGRVQQEEVEHLLGPGWTAPMEVVVDGRGRPVTSPQRLEAIADFQQQLEGDPGIATVAGLSRIANAAERLDGIKGKLATQRRGLQRLETGISRLHHGATLEGRGLLAAAQGSGMLDSGLGTATAGAHLLSAALHKTSIGSSRLSQGLGRADEGSGRLAEGASKVSDGAGKIASALRRARDQSGELGGSARLVKNAMRSGEARLGEARGPLTRSEEQLVAAWQALQKMTAGRADPEYAAALRSVEEASLQLTGRELGSGEQPNPNNEGVGKGIARAEGEFGVGRYLAAKMDENSREARSGIGKLARASTRLDRGLGKLADGSQQVADGVAALADGGEQLSPALAKVAQGAEHLVGGLSQLESGSGRLAAGLGNGARKSKLLSGGLGRVESGMASQGESGETQLAGLQHRSPGLFHSAYFVLAGLDGSRPEQRNAVGYLVDLDHGGQVARMLVVPRDGPTSAAAEQTKERIEGDGAALARKTGTVVSLGGVAPTQIEVNNAIRSDTPLLRLALALVSLLILVPVLRSLTIPLIAALLNLLTVSATFGLLALLFDGSLLGGPGYVDSTVISGTVMVMFGLAIDYEVFVFARIREEYVRTGSTEAAVRRGLDRTAHVVTGAATIMIAVFLAFSVSDFMSLRDFGVAQAIGIALDAFVIRLIIIPAVMLRLGEHSWWMPGPLRQRVRSRAPRPSV